MTYATVTLSRDDRSVATLTLNRPEKRNAIDAAMITELTDAIGKLGADGSVRAVILAGAGEMFCAGGDFRWMQEQAAKDRAGRMAEAVRFASMLRALDQLGKFVVARVHGSAFGGGLGLLCVCDVVIAVETASFVLSETKLGLIPATIGPYVLRRLGAGAARRIGLNAKSFTAGEAMQLGLVSRCVAPVDLDKTVEEEIAAALACAPGAIADAKALLRDISPPVGEAMLHLTAGRLADRWESAEGQAGLGAFFDKKPPPWSVS